MVAEGEFVFGLSQGRGRVGAAQRGDGKFVQWFGVWSVRFGQRLRLREKIWSGRGLGEESFPRFLIGGSV